MIPIRLTIEGFYSYKERQIIDFERLFNAGIFGIFGSVGSGKSAILDAVTYILYGKSERYNKNDAVNYNMMNLKSDKLYLELVFYASFDNDLYKIAITGKRSKKEFTKISSFNKQVLRKAGEEWQPLDGFDAEKVIGLSYGNFKKTVIIPQNQFMEFLRLTGKERSEVLKEIFKLEKYELYGKTKALFGKNASELERLLNEYEGVKGDDENKIKELEGFRSANKKEADAVKTEIKALRKSEASYSRQKEVFDKISRVKSELDNLIKNEKDYEERKAFLHRHIDVLEKFKESIFSSDKTSKKLMELEQRKNVLLEDEDNLKKEHIEKTRQLESLKSNYDKKESFNVRADEANRIIEIKKADSLSVNISKEILKIDADLKIIFDKKALAEKKLSEINKKLGAIQSEVNSHQSISILSEIKSLQIDYDAKNGILANIVEEYEKALEDKNRSEDDFNKVFLKYSFTQEQGSLFPQSDLSELLEERLKQYTHKLNETSCELEKHSLVLKLDEFSKSLEEGKPCPLCGSKNHPDIFSFASNEKRFNQLSEERTAIEAEIRLMQEDLSNAKMFGRSLSDRKEGLQNLKRKMDAAGEELKKLKEEFNYKGYSLEDKNKVDLDLSRLASLEDDKKELEKRKELLDKELNKIAFDEKLISNKKTEYEKDAISSKSRAETLKTSLKLLVYEDYHDKSCAELDVISKNFLSMYDDIERKHKEAEGALKELDAKINKVIGEKQNLLSNISSYRDELDGLNREISISLSKSSYSSLDEVREILSSNLDREKEQNEIEGFYSKKNICQNSLRELEKEAGNSSYDKAEHYAVLEKILGLEDALNTLNIRKGELNKSLDICRDNFSRKKELEIEIDEKEKRKDNIKVLLSMFKGSGFVEFISNIFLKELCNQANERFFKLTSNSLKLDISQDGDINIIDYLNGGKSRSIKSLSGGQTFQASLCLALALSARVQSLSVMDKSFFFLDEGFGTLDSKALKDVYLTLNSLRKENRVIGIISHVEELQQEIETHLKVDNSELRGSIIKGSWE